MRIAAARAAAPFLALLASLMALPAQAADPAVSLTLAQRWQNTASTGAWAPYTATIKNEGGTDFTGDLVLVANENLQRQVAGNWPSYRLRVTVQKATEQSFTTYVIQAPANYRAELRDRSGRVVAGADMQGGGSGGYAVGVLSDQHQADARIASYKPLGQTQVSYSSFASAALFPTSAINLSGLHAIVIDDFNSAALSQAQVQALKDFVGLGGSLIVAGGPTWRRTMVPLPAELSPLKPIASASAGLQPLADLDATTTKQVAQVVSGEVRGQVLLGAPDGPPLAVAGRYGAGQVIDLAYDPLAEPFASVEPGLGTVAWSEALSTGLLYQGSANRGYGPLGVPLVAPGTAPGVPTKVAAAPAPGGGVYPPGAVQAGADQVFNVLQDTPVAAVPPIGLLGGLLLGYVLLVAPLNYLLVRSVGRRELLWVTVPAVSLLFTVSAYAVGFGSRGTDFVDNEVQIQRLGPDGAVETQSYYGIYSPHKGDYWVSFPTNTLVSTALNFGDYSGISGDSALIEVGARPHVQIQSAAIWSLRIAQSLSLTHQAAGVEAHLSQSGNHVVGSLTNRGQRPLTRVQAVNGIGDRAELASSLAPGQTVLVDQEMVHAASISGQVITPPALKAQASVPASPNGTQTGTVLSTDTKRESVLRVAASTFVNGDPYELAILAIGEPTGGISIDGARITRYTTSAVVIPVRLEGVDSIAQATPLPRLVTTVQPVLNEYVDVYDLPVPSGVRAGLDLNYMLAGSQAGPASRGAPVRSLDVYDWSTGTWRALPQPPGTSPAVSTRDGLRRGEVQTSLIRVRVREAQAGYAASSLKLAERAQPLPGGGGS